MADSDHSEVTKARLALGLPRNRFASTPKSQRYGQAIVCKCIHCGKLFEGASFDLADVDHICKGDCGCQKSDQK